MDGQAVEPEGVLARLWGWWVGLSDAYAWQEIGVILVPSLVVLAIVMFWGIRRMHLGD